MVSPIRYVRRGLRVVRVDPSSPPASGGPAEPRPVPPAPVVPLGEDDYSLRLHRFASDLRLAARRYRRSTSWGDTPRTRPPSPVTPEQLKAARLAAGLTQWQLAARLRLSRSQVAEAETGRRYVNTTLGDWAAGLLFGEGVEE